MRRLCGLLVALWIALPLPLRAGEPAVIVLSWDGVRHFVETPMDSYKSGEMIITTRGANGELRAASLHVAVLSPDGELRFEGAGGLALLQRVEVRMDGRSNQFAVADRQKPFDDADALRRGIEAAFAKPLPASRARD